MGFSSCKYDELKLAEKLGIDIERLKEAMSETTVGSFATVWSVDPRSDSLVRGRISINKKNKQTNEYEEDFSGFVSFIGTYAAKKAANLKERDRIKLLRVDVSTKYDKEKNRTYTNYNIFDFNVVGSENVNPARKDPINAVDDGEVEPDEDKLPF